MPLSNYLGFKELVDSLLWQFAENKVPNVKFNKKKLLRRKKKEKTV